MHRDLEFNCIFYEARQFMSQEGTSKVKRAGSTAQRLRELPYEKRVCRLEDTGCLKSKRSSLHSSIEEGVQLLSEVGLDVLVVGPELYRELPHFKSDLIPHPKDADLDSLPRGLNLLHQKGILVLSYYPMNWPSKPRVPSLPPRSWPAFGARCSSSPIQPPLNRRIYPFVLVVG